jgi:UDP-N-acetylglucosamine 2-epimerase (hydrolysing)
MRKILFVTGTRADFGKLKPLMRSVDASPELRCMIFVTGMHTLRLYGETRREVERAGFKEIHVFHNQFTNETMDHVLANTIAGLSRYIHENIPDLIVVHGDRVETLASAIVGALNNILVAHVEGGERSGTVDELIRHAVSKLSHAHFVANREALERLVQMGESPETIFEIGSPDVDVMKSDSLPSLEAALNYYQVPFKDYGILLFHPVTTELDELSRQTDQLLSAIERSNLSWIVVYPNNDAGSQTILDAYKSRFTGKSQFRVFPSIRFEYFLVLLRHARLLLGNSSAGIREAPIYGVPSINVGSRQTLRYSGSEVVNVPFEENLIHEAIERCVAKPRHHSETNWAYFGDGDSATRFMHAIQSDAFWQIPCQKHFRDLL